MKLNEVAFFSLLFFTNTLSAQFSPDKTLPAASSAYLFPINPGKTSIITGTMGELRNTHFHAGLDIDTPGIGYPVLAVQDGYISRATCTTGGYGNVLYITHPDGNTTVYAHLEEFKGAVGDHVKNERYARKVSEIDLQFKPGQFQIAKGELIALSGNTGGSGGPHLHFEVRNSHNEALNPLTYGFQEVKDNMAPVVFKIALKTLTSNSRINDQFGRFEFSVVKNGNSYSLPHPILASGHIGVEILAHDKMENSRFRYGINYIDMKVNDQTTFSQHIDKINLAESRRILAVMDYRVLELRGARFNKLYIDDGNRLAYYADTQKKNGVTINKEEASIEILLKDYNANTSKVNFTLKPSSVVNESPILPTMAKAYDSEIIENTLKLSVKQCQPQNTSIEIWQAGKVTNYPATYFGKNQSVYLIDLHSYLPDSIKTCQSTIVYSLQDRIPSETEYTYYSDIADVEFQEHSLYDTTFLAVSYDTIKGKEFFRIGNRLTPLHQAARITIKPKLTYDITKTLGVYRKEGNALSFQHSDWRNGRIQFHSRELGDFVIQHDTLPPTITPIGINQTSARLRIRDNLSGINHFEANINGEWLLMVYDYKTGIVKSIKKDKNQPLKGDFEFKVTDQAGNEKIYKQKIL